MGLFACLFGLVWLMSWKLFYCCQALYIADLQNFGVYWLDTVSHNDSNLKISNRLYSWHGDSSLTGSWKERGASLPHKRGLSGCLACLSA